MALRSAIPYSGTENLQAMQEAKRYNAYLQSLIYAVLTQRNEDWGNMRVADFGAGAGEFAFPVSRLIQSEHFIAVEPDRTLRDTLARAGIRAEESLEALGSESLDFVYSFNVLEHIEDDGTILRTLARTLVPCGTLLLYVPAFQCLYSEMDRKVGHYRRYRKGPLLDKVLAAGFVVEEARYVDSFGFMASLAYRVLGGSGNLTGESVARYDTWVFPASLRLDAFTGGIFGKNLLVRAHKKPGTRPGELDSPAR